MAVEFELQAVIDTVPNAHGITPQTVIALPPSSLDSADDLIRVRINGVEITRQYDRTMVQP